MFRVGIDLGGTNLKAGIIGDGNRLLYQESIPTDAGRSAEEIAADMEQMAWRLCQKAGCDWDSVCGIGVGSPGIIDRTRGMVLYSNNFGWEDVPLTALLTKRIRKPVFLANDAQCAVLGEAGAGAGRGTRNLLMLTLGTGVGCGIILNGQLFEGAHGGGGIAGHTVIVRGGQPCTCGRRGCLEAYASATALIREGKRAVQEQPHSILAGEAAARGGVIDGKTVFDACEKGDPAAQSIVEEYLAGLGEGIVNLINLFRPDKILIGGGISNQGERITAPLNEYVRNHCFAGRRLFIPPVERAALGGRAGMIGAALLVFNQEKGGAYHDAVSARL